MEDKDIIEFLKWAASQPKGYGKIILTSETVPDMRDHK